MKVFPYLLFLSILSISILTEGAPSASRQLTGATIRNGSAVLTLPTTTGTLCGIAESCSLTNKVNIASTSATIGTLSVTGNVGIGGTVVSGTWDGTRIGVAAGGTGLISGTSGGVLVSIGTTSFGISNIGTTTQVFKGGAAPAFSQVVLTTDVSGILPVANGGVGAFKVTSAIVSSGTTISSEFGGDWLSVITNNSTGDSTLNLQASYYSGAPACVCTVLNDSNPNSRYCKIRTTSTSAVRVFTANTSDTAAAENYHIVCFGPG